VTVGAASRQRVGALLAGLLLAGTVSGADNRLERAVEAAYESHAGNTDGDNARYIPALAKADPEHFGIAVVTVDGTVVTRGDAERPFAIMSAAKPFTLALLLQQQGTEAVVEKIGVEPTGQPFNSLDGIDRGDRRPMNPMVNAGAITAVSLLQAERPGLRWSLIRDFYGQLAGEPLALMEDVYQSVSTSNYHNRAIINLLQEHQWLGADPDDTLDAYNRQSCVAVTARQLAVMGATLANGGVNPVTGRRVLEAQYVDEVLAVMLLSGFYDESGRWAYRAGLPAKSGVGGGIVAVVPGEMAIVGFSPRLSPAGNSVRGAAAIESISRELGLSLFL
jgi:glutaminase